MTNKLKPTDPYAAAGVNIEAGNTFVDSIKKALMPLMIKEFLGVSGGLQASFSLGINIKTQF